MNNFGNVAITQGTVSSWKTEMALEFYALCADYEEHPVLVNQATDRAHQSSVRVQAHY